GWKSERYEYPDAVELGSLLSEYTDQFHLDRDVTPELKSRLTAWRKEVDSPTGPANLVRDFYRLLNGLRVQQWPIIDPERVLRLGTLARFSELLADFEHTRRRARWVGASANREIQGGLDRGSWFYRNLFEYMQHYALDSYEEFSGEDGI